jgi:NitT/TauT family transport system permease protein
MRTHSRLWGGAGAIVVALLWMAVSASGYVRDFFLPSPIAVAKAIYYFIANGSIWAHIGYSVFRITLGFVVAIVTGVPLGIWLALNRKARAALEPLIDFTRYTPIPAFIPLFILWFGIGETEKVIVIFSSVFFQIVPMTVNSVSLTPRELIESARTLGATKWQTITRVLLPYSLPRIWDDLRVSMGWAWSVLIIAEMVGSAHGLGYVILQAQRLLQTATVMAAIVIIGTLGFVTDLIFRRCAIRWFPWVERTTSSHD